MVQHLCITNIATYRLNRPRSQFGEKFIKIDVLKILHAHVYKVTHIVYDPRTANLTMRGRNVFNVLPLKHDFNKLAFCLLLYCAHFPPLVLSKCHNIVSNGILLIYRATSFKVKKTASPLLHNIWELLLIISFGPNLGYS